MTSTFLPKKLRRCRRAYGWTLGQVLTPLVCPSRRRTEKKEGTVRRRLSNIAMEGWRPYSEAFSSVHGGGTIACCRYYDCEVGDDDSSERSDKCEETVASIPRRWSPSILLCVREVHKENRKIFCIEEIVATESSKISHRRLKFFHLSRSPNESRKRMR